MIFVVSGNGAGLTTKLKIMDRNYFIGTPEGGNSGGSKFDIMAFLPSLMGGGGKSLDPNLVAALMNNKGNQDAWGGGGCWWIWIILLFFVWGGWGYILRILKGESPKDVLASMPEKDFDKVSEVVGNLKATNLTRQQRRRIEREFKTVRR